MNAGAGLRLWFSLHCPRLSVRTYPATLPSSRPAMVLIIPDTINKRVAALHRTLSILPKANDRGRVYGIAHSGSSQLTNISTLSLCCSEVRRCAPHQVLLCDSNTRTISALPGAISGYQRGDPISSSLSPASLLSKKERPLFAASVF